MSDLSVAFHKAQVRLAHWLHARHPDDPEIKAIAEEAEKALHGAIAASQDVPILIADGGALTRDAGVLLADFVSKSINLADLIRAGADVAKAIADVKKALADFEAASK